jgi:RNA polymerase sigma factor (sigma-70 family)
VTEQEIRQLIRSSREASQRVIFDQYSNYVYTIVYSKLHSCGTHEDIEECVSDVFAKIFMSFDADHEGSLQGYIGIVAKRMAINAYYQLSRRPGSAFSLDDPEGQELASDEDVQQDYARKEMCRELLTQIRLLGEPDATIIIQKYYYQRNSLQIGKMLSMNPLTVRKRCERAIKRLRTMLMKEKINETEYEFG